MPATDLRPRPGGDPCAGYALPLVIVVLGVLSTLAVAGAVMAAGDLRLGGLESVANRSFLAAAAAVEHGTLVFDERGTEAGAWPVVGHVDGYDYEVALRRDTFDFGAGPAPVSHHPGRSGSALNGGNEGDPVWVLSATATRGRFRSRQKLWVVRTDVPRLPAALTTAADGRVRWHGWNISGLDSTPGGVAEDPGDASPPGACSGNRPAIHFLDPRGGPAHIPSDSVSGHPAHADGDPPYVTAGGAAWEGVLRALGASEDALEGQPKTGLEHHFSRPDSLSGLTWISDRAGGPLACLSGRGCADLGGRGILIVHNPRYDPREHDPSARWDPARAPASLENVTGGTFRGLAIVDRWPEHPDGPVNIHGALVVLAPPQSSGYRAPPGTSVRYSCDALFDAARAAGLGPDRLAWRPE